MFETAGLSLNLLGWANRLLKMTLTATRARLTNKCTIVGAKKPLLFMAIPPIKNPPNTKSKQTQMAQAI